tara:strand:- start:379 stop:696 length:318 start_codon:yes stop_codon:yes gene_type:complete
MVKDLATLPPLPVQLSVKVLSPAVLMVMVSLPVVLFAPDQAPEALHALALVLVQLTLNDWPTSTDSKFEANENKGTAEGDEPLPPPQELMTAVIKNKTITPLILL